jgi:NIMA (never in mitosis gene a)-related kinase
MKKIRCNSEIAENKKKELLKEAEILKKIDSEFIVSYYESFIYKGIPYLIMDYYKNGDLYEFIFKKKFNGGDKRKKIFIIFTKILLGLFELHK